MAETAHQKVRRMRAEQGQGLCVVCGKPNDSKTQRRSSCRAELNRSVGTMRAERVASRCPAFRAAVRMTRRRNGAVHAELNTTLKIGRRKPNERRSGNASLADCRRRVRTSSCAKAAHLQNAQGRRGVGQREHTGCRRPLSRQASKQTPHTGSRLGKAPQKRRSTLRPATRQGERWTVVADLQLLHHHS